MHSIKDFYNCDEDLTQKFKDFVSAIIADAKKALVLADCDCPYPAESQLARVLNSVREATQVVNTVANDYQYRVPDTAEKEAQIREAWGKAKIEADSIVIAIDKYTELVDILSDPVLERPDGSMCYCNPDVPDRMEDFGTSSEYGVCDGESKEVFNESIADALSAVARAQMLLGIADYRKKPSESKENKNV